MTAISEGPVDTPVLEPHTREWLEQAMAEVGDGPAIWELPYKDARKVLQATQESATVDYPAALIDDRVIPGGPTGDVQIRIVRPPNATEALPVVMHFHGGGWILGDRGTHERLDRDLANLADAAIVFVDYTPAPEAQYPVQNEQAYTALEWAAANADEFGADGNRIALFGDSVGGNMATVVAMMAKQRGGPQLAAQVLAYPVTDSDFETDSYRTYADGPLLTRAEMRWFWDAYLPDEERRADIWASPLRASLDDLRDLPPALVINGEHDVLRDEGEAYARKLSQAGVPVTQVRYAGTIHDFMLLNPIADTPAPRAATMQAADFLRAALDSEDTP